MCRSCLGHDPDRLRESRGCVSATLSHGRIRDVSVKKEIAVKKGPKRVFVDSGPPHSSSKPFSGKVFTVEMSHPQVQQAFPGDYVMSNIKGLDKYNMPRSGDVMVAALDIEVPVPQIVEEIVERPENLERIIERFGLGTEDEEEVEPGRLVLGRGY